MTNLENIDWAHLPFGYMKTDYNVRCTFKDGKWGEIEVTQDETINLHMAASCLHYGQEIFEGLKAFRGQDGKIRLFRPDENAKRLQNSARGILMEPLPEDIFMEMCKKVVKLNERFIPPYGSGSSLYLRPVEIGISPRVGVSPAEEYTVIIFVTPVGPYFKEGHRPLESGWQLRCRYGRNRSCQGCRLQRRSVLGSQGEEVPRRVWSRQLLYCQG